MTNKNFINKVLFYTGITVSCIIAFNYLVDPYNIFEKKPIKGLTDIKNHTISAKMTKFYQAKANDFDILLIGTSRTEHINPKDLERYLDGKAYNLGLQGSGISTQYTNIKYFLEKKKIHTVVLGLDFFSFSPENIDNYKHLNNTRYNDYYLKDYKDALLSIQTVRRSIKAIKESVKGKKQKIDKNGWDTEYYNLKMYKEKGEDWLYKRVNKPMKLSIGNFNSSRFKNPELLNEGFTILDKIVALCKEKNVKLVMFTSPLYKNLYAVIKEKGYQESFNYWKDSLKKYGTVYDFSYLNNVTMDYKNYIDPSHYQSHVGDWIFQRIFDKENIRIKDFGIVLK